MILEFDLGNTRGKWRLLSAGGVVGRGVVADGRPDGALDMSAVTFARAASVAGMERNSDLAAWVRQHCGCELVFATSENASAGVVNGYAEPGSLGVDRWVAVVAAYAEARAPVLVVDAGTALTLDIVDEHGRHQGGWILPGRALAAGGLMGLTAQIRIDVVPESSVEPGTCTADAVNRGAALAAVGAVALAMTRAPRAAVGYVTGGDAAWLEPLLPPIGGGWRRRDELVLDGLGYLLPAPQ